MRTFSTNNHDKQEDVVTVTEVHVAPEPELIKRIQINNSSSYINHYEEDSRYHGPPLINPRTPYHVEYQPRQIDKS